MIKHLEISATWNGPTRTYTITLRRGMAGIEVECTEEFYLIHQKKGIFREAMEVIYDSHDPEVETHMEV